MASAMRLKHSIGPLAAAESRLNFCNSSLQDSNSNEPNFNGSAIWDTLRSASSLGGQCGGPVRPASPAAATATAAPTPGRRRAAPRERLDNRQRPAEAEPCPPCPPYPPNIRPRHGTCDNSTDANFAAADYPLTERRRPTHPSSSSSASSASSSSSSSRSASATSSPLGSPGSPVVGGIVNPNYPGFEHLAAKLLKLAAGSDGEDQDDDEIIIINNNNNNNNNNNLTTSCYNNNINNNDDGDNKIDAVNRDCLDGRKTLYDKPKLAAAMADAFLSSAKEDLSLSRDFLPAKQSKAHGKMAPHGLHGLHGVNGAAGRHLKDSNRAQEEMDEEEEKYNKEATEKELDDCVVPRKKEKMAMNQQVRKARAAGLLPLSGLGDRDKRHSLGHGLSSASASAGSSRREKRSSLEILGGFDVYNIETAMPRIDLDLIESHLRAAKEEERRRRNDREEIRRRLAMGSEDADYYSNDQKPGKKPSLQARLQSGMNLQICFMNETLSDTESPGSEGEAPTTGTCAPPVSTKALTPKTESGRIPGVGAMSKPARPLSLPLRLDSDREWREHSSLMTEADFLARQAQLQTEARMALAQAKDMAHMQMELERQRQNASPITEMVRHTLQKVGVSFPEDRRRLSRQILTEMNVAQLQVIVNDLHTQIEYLNESLVRFLMERDDLHMEQDSMLVDIEDLTRYLGAKEQSSKGGANQNNNLVKSNGSTGLGRTAKK